MFGKSIEKKVSNKDLKRVNVNNEINELSKDLFDVDFNYFYVQDFLWNLTKSACSVEVELMEHNSDELSDDGVRYQIKFLKNCPEYFEAKSTNNHGAMGIINEKYYDESVENINETIMNYIKENYIELYTLIKKKKVKFDIIVNKEDVFEL